MTALRSVTKLDSDIISVILDYCNTTNCVIISHIVRSDILNQGLIIQLFNPLGEIQSIPINFSNYSQFVWFRDSEYSVTCYCSSNVIYIFNSTGKLFKSNLTIQNGRLLTTKLEQIEIVDPESRYRLNIMYRIVPFQDTIVQSSLHGLSILRKSIRKRKITGAPLSACAFGKYVRKENNLTPMTWQEIDVDGTQLKAHSNPEDVYDLILSYSQLLGISFNKSNDELLLVIQSGRYDSGELHIMCLDTYTGKMIICDELNCIEITDEQCSILSLCVENIIPMNEHDCMWHVCLKVEASSEEFLDEQELYNEDDLYLFGYYQNINCTVTNDHQINVCYGNHIYKDRKAKKYKKSLIKKSFDGVHPFQYFNLPSAFIF
eukprot:152890_1